MSILFSSFILTIMLCLIFLNINELVKVNKQKMYEFECGFNMLNNNRLSFSTQYFLITIMFLIFDLEIVLIVPIILENLNMIKEMMFINFLILILTLGLFLEWKMNILEWSK